MFITEHRIVHPLSLMIDGFDVEEVDDFKLLGITIDHNLFFNKYLVRLKLSLDQKLCSIKKSLYLYFISNSLIL